MNIIIIGFGRMGRSLAKKMIQRNHDVVAIDNNAGVFSNPLHKHERKVTQVVGMGFDRDTLIAAGIERAAAVAALTNSDETNALIARIAKDMFRVPSVVARTYDGRKAEIYNRLGIQTISSIDWGINLMAEMLESTSLNIVQSLGNGEVNIVRVKGNRLWQGKTVKDISVIGEINICAIKRDNKTFIPVEGTRIRLDDVLFLAVGVAANNKLKSLMGIPLV